MYIYISFFYSPLSLPWTGTVVYINIIMRADVTLLNLITDPSNNVIFHLARPSTLYPSLSM